MPRRFGSLAPAVALATAGLWFLAPEAGADVVDGHCSTASGVTVVVDFQELGGGTVVRCVEDVESGTTGLQVLQLAGLSPEGTIKEGPSFVCRVAGRPSATETLPVAGTDGYRESCVQAAPETAFWSYWHAGNGGPWTFSNYGASAREAIIGGYEGWSFSLNNSGSSNPPPRVAPAHLVPKSTPSAQSTSRPPAKSSPTTAPPSLKRSTSARVTPTPTDASAPRTTESVSPDASPSPSATPSTSSAMTVPESLPAELDAVASPPAAAPPVPALPPSGVPTGTLMGAGAVVALGVGGGVVWWRRRGL